MKTITFYQILKESLPMIEKKEMLKEKYLNLILEDMIHYDTTLKDYFNADAVYKEFYLKFKFLSILPDSLKFIKIFFFSSKNTSLKECVDNLKNEIDIMNGYFKENLIEDIKEIRENIVDVATFIIMNVGIDKVKELYKKNKILELIENKLLKMNIEGHFLDVIKWIDDYKNSSGIEEYNLLKDYLEIIFDDK